MNLKDQKIYYSIGEVAKILDVNHSLIRFWEKEFVQLKPKTRRGKRRFYQKKDLLVARKIRKLLYEEGLTIEGAKKNLTNKKNTIGFGARALFNSKAKYINSPNSTICSFF